MGKELVDTILTYLNTMSKDIHYEIYRFFLSCES